MTTADDGDATFVRIGTRDLAPVAVIAQSLDNQWVPRSLLARMRRSGGDYDSVEGTRRQAIRLEYLRALVNTEQVVINRAFLLNNAAISRDYLDPGPGRDTFMKLLDDRVIVPWLLNERSPLQETSFDVPAASRTAWNQVATECRMSCARLSWDDAENARVATDRLVRRFTGFLRTAPDLNFLLLRKHVGMGLSNFPRFVDHLQDVTTWLNGEVSRKRLVSRESFYRKFVFVEGSSMENGRIDFSKPYALAMKQLVDLSYNVNLADALAVFPLTPRDSLKRLALQELDWTKPPEEVDADRLLDFLRNAAFDTVQRTLSLHSLAHLSLEDVPVVRATEEWADYIAAMKRLIDAPMSFEEDSGAAAVHRAYVKLAAKITEIGRARSLHRRIGKVSPWVPIVELLISAGGATVKIVYSQDVYYEHHGSIIESLSKQSAPLVMRFIIRGWTEAESRSQLGISTDVMRRELKNAKHEWHALIEGLRKIKGFREMTTRGPVSRPTNQDFQEDPDAA